MKSNELIEELRAVKESADNHAMGHIRGVVGDAIEALQKQAQDIENLQKQFDLAIDFLEKLNTLGRL